MARREEMTVVGIMVYKNAERRPVHFPKSCVPKMKIRTVTTIAIFNIGRRRTITDASSKFLMPFA